MNNMTTTFSDSFTVRLSGLNEDHGTIYDIVDYSKYSNAFDIPEIKFLQNYKNPCWYERLNSRSNTLRCLPYFFIAGVEKCGTTDLYRALTIHPDIALARGKEPHFWGRDQHRGMSFGNSYLQWFDPAARTIQEHYEIDETTGVPYHKMVSLDATAGTLFHQFVWKSFLPELDTVSPNTRLSTPLQIKRLLPDAKFVVILRNPIERLYSCYLFYSLMAKSEKGKLKGIGSVFMSKGTHDFHQKVVLALEAMKNCSTHYGYFAKKCVHYNSGETNQEMFQSKLQGGLYSEILSEWLLHISIDRFYIVRLEDYTKDKYNTANDIFKFIKLANISRTEFEAKVHTGAANPNILKARIGPMLNETRDLLREFYRPFNERLAKLTGNDKFLLYNQ